MGNLIYNNKGYEVIENKDTVNINTNRTPLIVIPVSPSGKFYVKKSFKPTKNSVYLEFPKTHIEWNESPMGEAIKIIKEEMGSDSYDLLHYGQYDLNPDITNVKPYFILARDVKCGKWFKNNKDKNILGYEELDANEMISKINNREITDVYTILGFSLYTMK